MQITNQDHLQTPSLFVGKQAANKPADKLNAFADYLDALQTTVSQRVEENSETSTKPTVNMDTNQGSVAMNLDEYFSPKGPATGPVNLLDVPLLLPTAHNVDTLANYSEQKVKVLMEQYDIPTPPATIEFDQQGQMVLPPDYAYATQLEQAFKENPQVEEALRTTAALASHYAGIMEAQPFRDEMSTARTQADRDRIVEKYSYLFDDNRPPIHIVLSFLDDGSMLVGGKQSGNNVSPNLFAYSTAR